MIIATAGHVDHGKTLLIKSLTGVDTDRLPEEKKRNLTIDLGFAFLPVDDADTIGFIDVPGHEKFIRNMLCGVAGIDFVLFIVAADDGPMPQTREHLAILDLLDVSQGAVALTKVDRVEETRAVEISEEIDELFSGSSLAGIPVFPVSPITGDGINELKQHLIQVAVGTPPRSSEGNFRLAIDRSFNVPGSGLIVTGTVFSGKLETGDSARVMGAKMDVRVRSIHAQNTKANFGQAGQRCALNLAGAGLQKDQVRRGDWVIAGRLPPPTRKIDIRLRVAQTESRALAHWTPVHVHLGASETLGRVAILKGGEIDPGGDGLAQLVLDNPIGAINGDRLILRDQSGQRTIGGGKVIDINPPARGRSKPERITFLKAMEQTDEGTALAAVLDASPNGLLLDQFATTRNLTPEDMEILVDLIPMKSIETENGTLGFSPAHWKKIRGTALEGLAAWHKKFPDTVGPAENRIFEITGIRLPLHAAIGICADLAREGVIVKEGMGVRLPSHRPSLQGADATNWKKIKPLLVEGGLRPPVVVDIAKSIGNEPHKVESLLVRAGRQGLVVRIAKNRFYPPETLRRLAEIAETVAAETADGMITAANFRDASEIGRNLAIEVLEFFDKVKFTRRINDGHEILRAATDAFGGE